MTHVGIIGAGAIGGQLAALLDAAGIEVSVTARGASLEAIQTHGVRMTGATGTHTAKVHASSTLPDDVDLVIITTKAFDTADALAASPVAARVPVLVIQNGLDAQKRVAEAVGHERVAAGIATTAANSLEPGAVNVTARGLLFIGGPEAERFVELLAPTVPGVSEIENLAGAQWTKLIINMVNAPPAIVGMSVQDSVANPLVRKVITASMRETARIGRRGGIRFASLQGLTPALVRVLAAAPLVISQAIPKRMAKVMGSVPNLGSTQQSLQRGRRTEVDLLNGAVVDAAARIGLTAPVNEAITALVHEREAGSPALTPAQLYDAVIDAHQTRS